MRILIVEDETALARVLKALLERAHYAVDAVEDGVAALEYLEGLSYDAVVLDVMMPGLNGVEVVREMRLRGDATPVLMLTAMSGVDDRVTGLDAGADDYLPKPFATREFLARLRALLRRPQACVQNTLKLGNLCLDCATCTMAVGERRVRLNNKEFQMMELFMRNPRIILPAEQFLERIWGWDAEAEINLVWVNIACLRKKIAGLGADVSIRSMRGMGYVLEETPC